MTITIDVPSNFDPSLDAAILSPVTGEADVLYRFVADTLVGATPQLDAWASGPGGLAVTLTQATATSQPVVEQEDDGLSVYFDGADDVILVNVPAMTTFTMYVVFKPMILDGTTRIMVSLNALNVGFNNANKLMVSHSTGSTPTTATLDVGSWYATAVTVNGTAVSLDILDETINVTATFGSALDRVYLGRSGSAWYGGGIREVLICDSVHTSPQRQEQLRQLRNDYGAL